MLNMADKGSMDENERQKIKHLDTSVVNRIAAGEIIIQPANALKELLENSIDAKSTMIDILIKDGGLKLLQISDNGHGINKDDMRLLCERFTTSKLSKFEDLESIATYGFRGEALASISHIARLSVITKTKLSQLAYKAYYLNGKPTNANFKAEVSDIEPKPIAGKDGTQIIVEDLFYNVPSRLKTLKSKNDEFSKILDVIGRYAVHTEGVGFSCKKFGESYQVLVTRPTMTLTERIRTVFGPTVANELIDLEIKGDGEAEEDYIGKYGLVRVSGAITNSNYNNKKKIQPVFFINHRLVTCEPLKRAINSIYQFFLPKGNQPFMYLSLEIEPQNLDVNVHPTKREVRFLYEDEIIETISAKVHQLLSSIDSSRKFKTQNILSNKQDLKRSNDEFSGLSREYTLDQSLSQPPKKYRQENKLVRVDAQQSKLNTFLTGQTESNYHGQMTKEFTQPEIIIQEETPGTIENEATEPGLDTQIKSNNNVDAQGINSSLDSQYQISDRKRMKVNLESILGLRKETTDKVHKPLTNIFNNSSYIGIVDELRRLCCFQFDVKLFMCDYSAVLYEFFYQIALSEFCNYGELTFSETISLDELLEPLYISALNDDKKLQKKTDVILKIMNMKDMFMEYFQINFTYDADGKASIIALPMLLKNVKPYLSKLPYFIYRLGSRIDYENERECLNGILKEISKLYVPESISNEFTQYDTTEISGKQELAQEYEKQKNVIKRNELDHVLEHALFPALKQRFLATENILGAVVQIADLPGLYKCEKEVEYLNSFESSFLDLDSYHNSSDCKVSDIKMLIETSANEKYMNTLNFDCFPKSVHNFKDSPEFFQQIIFIDYQLQLLVQREFKQLSIKQCRDAFAKNNGSLQESLTNLLRFAESLETYHDIPNTSHEEKLYYAVIMTHLYYLSSQPEELLRTNEKFESSIPSTLHSSAYVYNDFVEYLACRQIVLLGLSDEQGGYKLWAKYLITLKKPFTKSNIASSRWLEILFGEMTVLLSNQDKKLIAFNGDIKTQGFAKNNLMLVLFSNYLLRAENRHILDADFRTQFSNYMKIHIESIITNENHFPDASSENHDLNFFVYNLYETLGSVPMKYQILSGLLSKKLLINLSQKSYQSQVILRTLIKTLIDREEYDEAYAAFKTYISYIEKDQEQHNEYIHDILSIIDTYSTCILSFNPFDSLSLQSNDSKKFKYVTRDQILHSLDECAVKLMGYLSELASICDLEYDESPNSNHISFLYLNYNDNVIQEDNSNFIRLISKSWYSLGYYYYYICSFELPNYETIDTYTSKVLKYYKNSLIINTTGNILYLFNYALVLSYNRSIQQAIKLCKFILKRHPESFKTWNLLALLLSSLETHSSGENTQNQKHTYQFNVTIDGSITDTMNGSANGTAASNIQVTNIRELEKIINNGLNIAGISLVRNRKSNLSLTNETKFDILQLKLTQLSIWESSYGTHYILEYLPEVFVLYNELFDIDIDTHKNDDGQLRTNIAKWSHRPSFIDPSSNHNNDIKQVNHLSKEKKLAKDKIKRMSKISKTKEKHDNPTNNTSMKKLNVTERKILQDIWVWASKIYLKIGLLEEAEQCIVEAESIHESNTKTITSLGLICSGSRKFLALQEFERSLEILNEPINYYKKKELGTTLLGLCKLIILDDNIDNSLFISTKDLSSGLIRLKNYLELFSQSWPFGYNNSEIWWYLSLIYEKIDDKVMLAKSLWKCVELEDLRPVRDFDCCSEFIP